MPDKFRPIKDAFGRFATGVAVAACAKQGGGYAAMTVNSFTSVSLSPPLVLWCIETKAASYPAFMAATGYSVTILRADQRALSDRFANFAPEPVSPDEVEFWETGAPILKHRLAAFDCKIFARHEAGDHVVLVGEVVKFDSSDGAPLVYFASNYQTNGDAK
ncbi:NADH-FMN oxidoreductase [hydrothermal vent metagenome]|uniref:NADH-FMN oxidoreductase n=1 Tax=hydrothermal vent metagenome TaxID=652676 RepID=A0A3B0S1T9_9ZZZZ